MGKSARGLMNSQGFDLWMSRTVIMLVLLAYAAYLMPWLSNPGVSLSLGAYDLAEWTSLHPGVRSSAPMLLTPFLLRLPVACLALVLAFSQEGRLKWLLIILTAIALLPPLEFFRAGLQDMNHRQQLALAIFTLLAGGMSQAFDRWRTSVIVIAAGVAGVTGIWGLLQAYSLMQAFDLPVQMGPGGLIFVVLCLGQMIYVRKEKRGELATSL